MDLTPTLLSTGWASGVNSYLTVALLGILGRAGVGPVPEGLQSRPVIAAALVLFAVEFVVDKVPWLDSAWDSIHTVVRPAVGSAVGLAFAGDAHVSAVQQALGAGGSGATALASHAVKAGVRLAVNASPEPFSNILLSLAEDGVAAAVVAFALNHPVAAAAVAMTLLAAGLVLVAFLLGRIRRGLRRLRQRRAGPAP